MAQARIIENIFENKTIDIDGCEHRTVRELIEGIGDGRIYEGTMFEVYDADTGETSYVRLEDDDENVSVTILVNGRDYPADYEIQKDDSVVVTVLPAGGDGSMERAQAGWAGALVGYLSGSIEGGLIGLGAGGPWGFLIGAAVGGTVGTVLGFIGGIGVYDSMKAGSSTTSGSLDAEEAPGIRGSSNQGIIGNSFPLVLGRHLATPLIVGTPVTVSSGDYGRTQSVKVLFAVAYSPLKLTNFRLGEMLFAHNESWKGNKDLRTVMHGLLSIYDEDATGSSDKGEIISKWKSNNLKIEILQNDDDHDVDYGTIYNEAQVQDSIDATPLYILDGALGKVTNYKGSKFASGYRNNTVRFSQSNPMKIDLEFEASSGLYETWSHTSSVGNSWSRYRKVPVWYGVQWRIHSDSNIDMGSDYGDEYSDSNTGGWHSFETLTGGVDGTISAKVYDYAASEEDRKAHLGNDIDEGLTWYDDKIPEKLYNGLVSLGIKTSGDTEETSENFSYDYLYDLFHDVYILNIVNIYTHIRISTLEYRAVALGYAAEKEQYYKQQFEDVKAFLEGMDFSTKIFTEDDKAVLRGYMKELAGSDWMSGVLDGGSYSRAVQDYQASMNLMWIGCKAFNFSDGFDPEGTSTGDSEHKEHVKNNISTSRFTTSVSFTQEQMQKILSTQGNSSHMVDIRVVRISPGYVDQTNGEKDDDGAYDGPSSFQDVVTWTTMTTHKFDTDTFEAQKPLSEQNMKKLCLVALYAESFTISDIKNQLSKFTVDAESFAPTYDAGTHTWSPESVETKVLYKDSSSSSAKTITREQYLSYRQAGVKAMAYKEGNDFTSQMKALTLRAEEQTTSGNTQYVLPSSAEKYVDNNVMSVALLWCLGAHAGKDAVGYDFFNMHSLGDAYEFCESVSDGSTYSTAQYDDDGNVIADKGDLIKTRYTANAYLTKASKADTVLTKILAAGRSLLVRDEMNRVRVVVDKPVDYVSGIINQQNRISGSVSYSYEDLPSGLSMNFSNEEDGYQQTTQYAMMDNESSDDPRGNIEDYSMEFVTNPVQLWQLGRYVLANRVLGRRILTQKVGREGFSAGIGDVMAVQDSILMLYSDHGARVSRLIEDDDYIYGFLTDELYTFNGDTDNGESVEGFEIFQPGQTGINAVIKMRIALAGTSRTIEDEEGETETFTQEVGETNVVLFEYPVAKDGHHLADDMESDILYYNPTVDDIVSFGYFDGTITEKYRIVKIKGDKDFNFTLTLYPYLEEFYSYGRAMPVLPKNLPTPDTAGEEYNLTDALNASERTESNTASVEMSLQNSYARVLDYWAVSSDKETSPATFVQTADSTRTDYGEMPEMTSEKPYLWGYTKFIRQTGAESDTQPAVVGMKGEKGDAGTDYIVDLQPDTLPVKADASTHAIATTVETDVYFAKESVQYATSAYTVAVYRDETEVTSRVTISANADGVSYSLTFPASLVNEDVTKFKVTCTLTAEGESRSDTFVVEKNYGLSYLDFDLSASAIHVSNDGTISPSEVTPTKYKISDGKFITEDGYLTIEERNEDGGLIGSIRECGYKKQTSSDTYDSTKNYKQVEKPCVFYTENFNSCFGYKNDYGTVIAYVMYERV